MANRQAMLRRRKRRTCPLAFCFFIGIFYVNPYCYATQAEMYRFLRTRALENGIATLEELPGVQPLPQ